MGTEMKTVMCLTIREAKEVLKLFKTKTNFSIKFQGEKKTQMFVKIASFVKRGRFGGTDILLKSSSGKHYRVFDRQSKVSNIGPLSPSSGINSIFNIQCIEDKTEKHISLSPSTPKQPYKLEVLQKDKNVTILTITEEFENWDNIIQKLISKEIELK